MNKWNLWLDDQLNDPVTPGRHTPEGFIGAKSTEEAVILVQSMGLPSMIDFDHDLGENDTCRDFLKWLTYEYDCEPTFKYNVHSANPLAKEWIDDFINSWKRSLNGG